MVSKAVPIGIFIFLVAAALLGVFFLSGTSIQVGEPFDIPYEECIQGLEQNALFTKAVKRQSTAPCAEMVSSQFCEAVITADESLCEGDATCAAFVRKDVEKCDAEDVKCRAFVTGDTSLCDELDISEIDVREECKALASLNHSYFSSKVAKQNCLDAVVHVLASTESDCGLISSEELRMSCESNFS